MADKTPPSRAGAPWWSEPGRTPNPPEDQPDASAERSARSSSLDWIDRREPFLNALAARLEPLEERARRIETDMAAFREDVRSFTEETERTMGELEKELIALRDRADEHAGRLEHRLGTGLQEVAAAEESFRARVADADEKTGGRIAELGQKLLERLSWAKERSDERVDAAERSL
jgi:DNA anti-recombination protein RmuC